MMPDYENDIVFKPELTWEELCEWAKSKGGKKHENSIHFDNFVVWKHLDENKCRLQGNNATLVGKEHRSYEQMKTIIQALYEE